MEPDTPKLKANDSEDPYSPGLADTQKRMNGTLTGTTDSNLLTTDKKGKVDMDKIEEEPLEQSNIK